MALDDLQGVIEELRGTIETHRDCLSGRETRTRQVLIDPLLSELGWDVSDPDSIQLEFSVGSQRADYALISNSQPVAVIEAKKLGSDLEDDEIMQVLGYANLAGIPYMIVTDGDKWGMYEVFRPVGGLDERRLMKLELFQQTAHQNALQALAMWKPNLASGSRPSEAVEPVFISPTSATNPPNSQFDEPREPQPDNSLGDSDNWCTFEWKLYPQGTRPTSFKIGDRPAETIGAWKDVVHKVIAWLVDEEILRASDCPIGTNKLTFIGREAVNRDGTSFDRPQQLSNGLISNRGFFSTPQQWRKLRRLLSQFGVDKNTIKMFYS